MVVAGPPMTMPEDGRGVREIRRGGEDPLVEDVRVGRSRLIAPESELCGQHHVAARRPCPAHPHPCGQVGHAGTGQHGIGTDSSRQRVLLLVRRTTPPVSHFVTSASSTIGVASASAFHDIGSDRPSSQRSCSSPIRARYSACVAGSRTHSLDIAIELVRGRGVGGSAPVRDVLAVAAHGQSRRIATARVRAVRRLDDRQHTVGRDADPVPEALDVVEHPLDRRHDAPPGGPGTPDALEQRFGEHKVAGRVGRGGVDQGHIGRERLEQAERPERRVDDLEGVVVRHGRTDQRPGDGCRQAARGRLQPLAQA